MSYYPEEAAHVLEILRTEEAIGNAAAKAGRTHALEKWLELIHTPRGTAEHNLCAYVGILSARPEQPIDFPHLESLVREADLSWVSLSATKMTQNAKAKKKKAASAAEARLEKEALAKVRQRVLTDIYNTRYIDKFGGGRNANAAAQAILDNWEEVTRATDLEGTKPLRHRGIADIIRKSPRYQNN